ncbi:MAG: HAD family hydrolase [Nitrososphaerales archaeon]
MDYAGGIYEDVRLIQEFAKKYMIVITTNNPRSLLEHKLRGFKYAENISSTFSSISDFGKIVKNRNFYTQVCKELGTKPEYILHVGDDPFYDVIEPRAVGISALLIDRDGKDGTLHNLYDLRVMLQNH